MTELTHEERLQYLANARIEAETWKAHMQNLIADTKNSDDYKDAESRVKEAEEAIDHLSEKIKAEALATFTATGNKKQEGVEVKGFGVVKDYDKAKAREWCLTDFRPALKLDEKTFEKAVKDGTVPETIATAVIEYRAQIATDLSKYLPSAIPGAANA